MSAIYPFAALRPSPAAAADVAAVPYDVVNTEEARALAANPLSFLHVSRPEIDLPAGADPHGDAVYQLAAANFQKLRAAAPLVVEDAPSFYIYRLTMGSHLQSGVAACFSIDEYDRGLIKKHEKTRPDKEDDRTRHLLAIGAQTGPVFLTYRASAAVDAVVARAITRKPLFNLTAADGVRHEVWRVDAADHQSIVDAFAAIRALYIADGHHRAASAARARRTLQQTAEGNRDKAEGTRQKAESEEYDRVLAVAFPDNQMQVLPYNRVVKDLHGLTAAEFLASLKRRLTVRDGGPATPARKGEIAIYLAGRWHTLVMPAAAVSLDVDLLQTSILDPILGIDDVRTDKRIDFVGGIRGTGELEQLVDSGAFAVAFSLFPVSVDDLMRIADAGGIMPPKSTWFEPKLRDGLLSHII
ncbi:MAG: DUF1015 family protein [Acidobacteriota bacterium]|nr:DUF1015 family protein [Acidobacteriota bacterium]